MHLSAIDSIIRPWQRDLGGFSVRRVLPAGPRQMVGPFIFFDALGPATFAPGTAWMSGPTRTSVWQPSPGSSRANCCTGTTWPSHS